MPFQNLLSHLDNIEAGVERDGRGVKKFCQTLAGHVEKYFAFSVKMSHSDFDPIYMQQCSWTRTCGRCFLDKKKQWHWNISSLKCTGRTFFIESLLLLTVRPLPQHQPDPAPQLLVGRALRLLVKPLASRKMAALLFPKGFAFSNL
jgi:hypothetical protein